MLWRNRAFRLFWVGQSVNQLGSFVSTIALPLLAVGRLHASTVDVALLEAVQWIPAVLIGLPVGALVDRGRRHRRIMMFANIGQAASLASVPLTAAAGVISVATLLGAATATGLFEVFFTTAYQPYVRELVPTEQLVTANSRLQSSQSVAQISGPSIGGVLVQLVGAATSVMVDAASFLVSWLCLWAVHADETTPVDRPRRPMLADIADGIRTLWQDRVLATVATVSASANLLLTAIGAVEIVFLVRAVHLSSGAVGAVITAGGVGGLIGALLADRISARFGIAATARAALAVTAPFTLLMPLARPGPVLGLFVLAQFVAVAGIAVASVTLTSIRQSVCPPDRLGRVSAGSRLLMSATIPTGALVGGVLGQQFGTRTALLIGAAGYTVVGLAALAGPLRHVTIGSRGGTGSASPRPRPERSPHATPSADRAAAPAPGTPRPPDRRR
jgi:MFS family permease